MATPSKRAVPDTRWRVASWVMATVKGKPGMRHDEAGQGGHVGRETTDRRGRPRAPARNATTKAATASWETAAQGGRAAGNGRRAPGRRDSPRPIQGRRDHVAGAAAEEPPRGGGEPGRSRGCGIGSEMGKRGEVSLNRRELEVTFPPVFLLSPGHTIARGASRQVSLRRSALQDSNADVEGTLLRACAEGHEDGGGRGEGLARPDQAPAHLEQRLLQPVGASSRGRGAPDPRARTKGERPRRSRPSSAWRTAVEPGRTRSPRAPRAARGARHGVGRLKAAAAREKARSERRTSSRLPFRISRQRARGLRARRVMSRKPGPARARPPCRADPRRPPGAPRPRSGAGG